MKVSKPYRYARKIIHHFFFVVKLFVSKPYRYARKAEASEALGLSLSVSKPYRYARKELIYFGVRGMFLGFKTL